GEPIQVDPRLMIADRQIVEGFWLGHWMPQRSIPSALLLFREIAALIRQQVLHSQIGQVYPLERIAEAAPHAETVARQGQVLIEPGWEWGSGRSDPAKTKSVSWSGRHPWPLPGEDLRHKSPGRTRETEIPIETTP